MKTIIDKISIDGKVLSRGWLEANYDTLGHGILSVAYSMGAENLCLCKPEQPQPISIRALDDAESEDGIHYILARMPKSWTKHADNCVFRQTPDMTGAGNANDAAIRTDIATGLIDIAVDVRLSRTDPKPKDAPEPEQEADTPKPKAKKRGSSSRNSVRLLGLLRWMWSAAELNTWRPYFANKRYWSNIQYRLVSAVENVTVKGRGLDKTLYIPPMFSSQREAQLNDAWNAYLLGLSATERSQHFGILVGEVKSLDAWGNSGKVFALRLRQLRSTLSVYAELQGRLHRSYPWLAGVLDKESNLQGDRAICIATFSRNEKGFIAADEIALMRVTTDWIPIDSGFEGQIARRLVADRRSFEKPLQYDPLLDETFPDFLLLDAGAEPLPMEVFGFSGEEYELRKAEKIQHYQQSGKPWWFWEPAELPSPTPFPPAHQRGEA